MKNLSNVQELDLQRTKIYTVGYFWLSMNEKPIFYMLLSTLRFLRMAVDKDMCCWPFSVIHEQQRYMLLATFGYP